MTYLSKEVDSTNLENKISPYVFCCYWTSHNKAYAPNQTYLTGGFSPIMAGHYNSFPSTYYTIANFPTTPRRDVHVDENWFNPTSTSNDMYVRLVEGYEYFVDVACADFIRITGMFLDRNNGTYLSPFNYASIPITEKYIPNEAANNLSATEFRESYAYAKFKLPKTVTALKPTPNLYFLTIRASNNLNRPIINYPAGTWMSSGLGASSVIVNQPTEIHYINNPLTPDAANQNPFFDSPNVRILIYGIPL